MSDNRSVEPGGRALTSRSGASRRLLSRKARGRAATELSSAPLETNFPDANGRDKCEALRVPDEDGAQRPISTQQLLTLGDVTPNPRTVVAVVVSIVAGRGEVSRADLLDQMRDSAFPHPSARPQDTSWCQGYVAGALRQGFLAMAEASTDATSERSATLVLEC